MNIPCTCTDTACPNHPTNHGDGCTRCIQKCLRLREIPSCFFRLLKDDIRSQKDFSIEGFASFVQQNSAKNE